MHTVSSDYIAAATAAGRKYHLDMFVTRFIPHPSAGATHFERTHYYDGDGIISLKIVRGQTTGGFALGGTYSATLTATLTTDVTLTMVAEVQSEKWSGLVFINSIIVRVGFDKPNGDTEWLNLGEFHIYDIKKGLYNQTITAYDHMYSYSKEYRPSSKLTYPVRLSAIYKDCVGIPTAPTMINDTLIDSAPIAGTTTDKETGKEIPIYYTKRDMLGYIAAVNGGFMYKDPQSVYYKISTPKETHTAIYAENVISQSINLTSYKVNEIIFNDSGTSASSKTDYKAGTVELVNPLNFTNRNEMMTNLKREIEGLTYDSVTIKKQGTGVFELGDLVNYIGADETLYRMYIMGITYEFSNGFFTETLYSLAKSEAQQSYGGGSYGGTTRTVEKLVSENFCDITATTGIMSDEGYCRRIEF